MTRKTTERLTPKGLTQSEWIRNILVEIADGHRPHSVRPHENDRLIRQLAQRVLAGEYDAVFPLHDLLEDVLPQGDPLGREIADAVLEDGVSGRANSAFSQSLGGGSYSSGKRMRHYLDNYIPGTLSEDPGSGYDTAQGRRPLPERNPDEDTIARYARRTRRNWGLGRRQPPQQYDRSPSGGVVVRGLYYPGGKYIPSTGKPDSKMKFDQYAQISAERNNTASRKYQRADGSFDADACMEAQKSALSKPAREAKKRDRGGRGKKTALDTGRLTKEDRDQLRQRVREENSTSVPTKPGKAENTPGPGDGGEARYGSRGADGGAPALQNGKKGRFSHTPPVPSLKYARQPVSALRDPWLHGRQADPVEALRDLGIDDWRQEDRGIPSGGHNHYGRPVASPRMARAASLAGQPGNVGEMVRGGLNEADIDSLGAALDFGQDEGMSAEDEDSIMSLLFQLISHARGGISYPIPAEQERYLDALHPSNHGGDPRRSTLDTYLDSR